MVYNRIKASFFLKLCFLSIIRRDSVWFIWRWFIQRTQEKRTQISFSLLLMTGIYLNLLVVFISTIIIDGDSDLVRHLF